MLPTLGHQPKNIYVLLEGPGHYQKASVLVRSHLSCRRQMVTRSTLSAYSTNLRVFRRDTERSFAVENHISAMEHGRAG
ncbi:hypothetical protein N7476_004863 [Penicillium atrosanguineum]|uniref:Uncharacterized protein n=1 Tax=Penicillium atrosanguineum TaxID=1132637 RepID=A0A9W9PY95_9EURO|nr:hypothetical protein N7526_001835 [Penicillium atrosanguineum]KAJ5318443.1 hypothetical protein N7476_004863 [Penicillium atrosanguineum]